MIVKYLIIYLLESFMYVLISKKYAYMGFEFIPDIKLIFIMLILNIFIILFQSYIHKKTNFSLQLTLFFLIIQYLFPESIYVALGAGNYYFYFQYFIIIIILNLIILAVNYKIKVKLSINRKKIRVIRILTYGCSMLFISNYRQWNIQNLLLRDIYITRKMAHRFNFLGYLVGPLSRVMIPFLFVYDIEYGNYRQMILNSISLSFIFLSGAIKSVLFSSVMVIIFYFMFKFRTKYKLRQIMNYVILLFLFSIIGFYFYQGIILDYLRRILFIPSLLNTSYYNFFKGFPSYSEYGYLGNNKELTQFFGTNVLNNPGNNANIGILTEGYVYFNENSFVLYSLIFVFIILTLNLIIPVQYFGIIYMYLYYINTSRLKTLIITHGLLFLYVFFFLNTKTFKVTASKRGRKINH